MISMSETDQAPPKTIENIVLNLARKLVEDSRTRVDRHGATEIGKHLQKASILITFALQDLGEE